MNKLEDLFTKTELATYELLGWPANVDMLNLKLTAKLKEEPDYELWVPLNYHVSLRGIVNKDLPTLIQDERILVSSKGKIWRESTGNATEGTVRGSAREDGNSYLEFSITDKEKGLRNKYAVARAVCCCFIPLHSPLTWYTAVINHKDSDKSNNDFTNLEWTTQSDNVRHAIENGIRVYAKGLDNPNALKVKCIVRHIPGWEGTEFILVGGDERKQSMMFSVNKVLTGELKQCKGCEVDYLTEDELNTLPTYSQLPGTLRQAIRNHDNNFKGDIYGINGKTLEVVKYTDAKGLTDAGFTTQLVYSSMTAKPALISGWMFTRIIPGESLAELTERLKGILLDYYRNSHYRIRVLIGTSVKDGAKVTLVGKEPLKALGMNPKLAYKEADVPKHTYKGYILNEIPFELEHLKLM